MRVYVGVAASSTSSCPACHAATSSSIVDIGHFFLFWSYRTFLYFYIGHRRRLCPARVHGRAGTFFLTASTTVFEEMVMDMCIDMCIDMYIDMCVGACTAIRWSMRHVPLAMILYIDHDTIYRP